MNGVSKSSDLLLKVNFFLFKFMFRNDFDIVLIIWKVGKNNEWEENFSVFIFFEPQKSSEAKDRSDGK